MFFNGYREWKTVGRECLIKWGMDQNLQKSFSNYMGYVFSHDHLLRSTTAKLPKDVSHTNDQCRGRYWIPTTALN